MRKRLAVCVGVCLCGAALAPVAFAQAGPSISIEIPICGGQVTGNNASSQFGVGRWIMYTVTTSVGFDLCVTQVKAEAFVVGVAGSAVNKAGRFGATATKQVPVPFDATWITAGTHKFSIVLDPFFDYASGGTQSSAQVTYRPEPEPFPDLEPDTCEGEIDPETGKCIWNYCPIIINMDRRSYKLAGVSDGVLFDLKGNGAMRRIGWTKADSSEAFLALDRNGNGRIDDGTELWGTATPVMEGRATAANGFDALSLSLGNGGHDNTLDARSELWSRLLLWTDSNHNGMSEPGELAPLANSGIEAIHLDYKFTGRRDASGNWFRQRADLRWTDGTTSKVYDVWLTIR
jgi:hypothetical protein